MEPGVFRHNRDAIICIKKTRNRTNNERSLRPTPLFFVGLLLKELHPPHHSANIHTGPQSLLVDVGPNEETTTPPNQPQGANWGRKAVERGALGSDLSPPVHTPVCWMSGNQGRSRLHIKGRQNQAWDGRTRVDKHLGCFGPDKTLQNAGSGAKKVDKSNSRVIPNRPVANSHRVPDRVVVPNERLGVYNLDQRTPPRGLHPNSRREAISMDPEHNLKIGWRIYISLTMKSK